MVRALLQLEVDALALVVVVTTLVVVVVPLATPRAVHEVEPSLDEVNSGPARLASASTTPSASVVLIPAPGHSGDPRRTPSASSGSAKALAAARSHQPSRWLDLDDDRTPARRALVVAQVRSSCLYQLWWGGQGAVRTSVAQSCSPLSRTSPRLLKR